MAFAQHIPLTAAEEPRSPSYCNTDARDPGLQDPFLLAQGHGDSWTLTSALGQE